MVFHGSRWVYMVFMVPGLFFLWFFMVPGGLLWFSWLQVGFYGFFMVPGWCFIVPGWCFIVPGESSWLFMAPGWFFLWFQVGFHGFSWFQVGFSRCQVGFHGFLGKVSKKKRTPPTHRARLGQSPKKQVFCYNLSGLKSSWNGQIWRPHLCITCFRTFLDVCSKNNWMVIFTKKFGTLDPPLDPPTHSLGQSPK